MAGRYCDAGQIRHLVRLHLELIAAECARARLQDQVEGVLGVHCQATELGAVHVAGLRDGACLAAIAVQREAPQLGSRDVYGIPLKHHRRLRGIPASDAGCGRRLLAKGAEYLRLERVEGGGGVSLGLDVAAYVDVDDAAGGDVGREQYGGEFDLRWGQLRTL